MNNRDPCIRKIFQEQGCDNYRSIEWDRAVLRIVVRWIKRQGCTRLQEPRKTLRFTSFDESMSINFYGTLNAIKSVLPEMQQKGSGHIVIVNSLDAKKGIIGDAPYVAAKAALDGFGDTLRQEMKNSHINITSIFPGRVDTPMIRNIRVPRLSPKIPPGMVAKAIIKGIQKNKAIIIIPSAYTPIAVLNTIMPRLFDWVYRVLNIEGERIDG